MIWSNKGYGCTNAACAHFETCSKAYRNADGRTYQDYLSFLGLYFGVQPVEIDTVMGSVGGKALYTMMFSCGLMLAFLRDARTSQTTTRIFNMLQDIAGLEFFMTLFPAVLADNGPEFSNPKMVEFFRPDPKHNPTRLERRT